MPSGVTQPLYDGESLSFPEFAQRTARVVGPWVAYEREAPLNTPLSDGFESFSVDEIYNEKSFREAAVELAEVVSWTTEEAEAKAHQSNLRGLKSHLQIVRSKREHRRQYEFMSTQVAAWVAPTEEHEVMRTAMQQQLDETYWFDLLPDERPRKITGEELRQIMIRDLARRVLKHHEEMDVKKARTEQDSAFAQEFKESLTNWQDVPVPRRILP